MVSLIDETSMLTIINSGEFKMWLISKRWFGNKLFLNDLNFKVHIEYFKALSENIFLIIITILKNDYSNSYFLPLITFKDLIEILDPSETNYKWIQVLKKIQFSREITFLEAEYCLLFWKTILGSIDIHDAFNNPNTYIFLLRQLGKDNTTNTLFSLEIKKKENSEKPLVSYVLKSYKNYSENLEIIKLRILNENGFKNVPKIYGSIDIHDINVIGIMELVSNRGNIGDIYWNELNDMMHEIYFQEKIKNPLSYNKNECINAINTYCIESLKISSLIGIGIDLFLKGLIKPENDSFSVDHVQFSDFFNQHISKVNSISSRILKKLHDLDYSTNTYKWNLANVEDDILKVQEICEKLREKFKEKKIRIQPIHQDLHMEQILYDKNNGDYEYFFLDFEGDPQLSIQERKKKYPIEKDVAYFLRSLSYIKLNTLMNLLNESERLKLLEDSEQKDLRKKAWQTMLTTWELYLKEKILENIQVNPILIEIFTIERILNEIIYEILYRPENMLIPILGLIDFLEQYFMRHDNH